MSQPLDLPSAEASEPRLPPRRWWRGLLRTPSGIAGAVVMVVLLALSVTSWLGLTPYDPVAQNAAIRLQAPSGTHLFGTDLFGRDIFSRSVAGLANSVRVAVLAVAAAAFVGVLAGLLGGYFRGVTDAVSGGIANILFAFPPLLLALTLASVLQRTWVTVALAIAVVYVPIFYRVTRGPVLSLREREFVKAAVSTAMIATSIIFDGLDTQFTASSPEPICSAPKPSEATVPNSVATMASPSMTFPAGPLARRDPRSGVKAADSSWPRPFRYVE